MLETKITTIFDVEIVISGDEESGFTFEYKNDDGTKASINIAEPCYIHYSITDNTQYGFVFDGIAFNNPFNGVITKAEIQDNGLKMILTDPWKKNKSNCEDYSVSFEFGFKHTKTSPKYGDGMLLLSKDPEIINTGSANCPPPSH